MIPEIGNFALILALSLAIVQAVLPLAGAHRGDVAMMGVGRTAATGQFFFVAVAFGCLTWAFLTDDFSVLYLSLIHISEPTRQLASSRMPSSA